MMAGGSVVGDGWVSVAGDCNQLRRYHRCRLRSPCPHKTMGHERGSRGLDP